MKKIKVLSIIEFNNLKFEKKIYYFMSIYPIIWEYLFVDAKIAFPRDGSNFPKDATLMLIEYINLFALELKYSGLAVTEMFDGWKRDSVGVETCRNGMAELRFYHHHEDFNHQRYTVSNFGHTYIHTIVPKTLDDFRNDCERAGIELFWRIK